MRIFIILLVVMMNLFGAYPTMTITPLGGTTTSESGTSISFNVTLDSKPDDNISITPAVTDNSEAKVTSWNEQIFYDIDGMWDQTRTVTIQGLSDGVVDGDITYSLKFFVGTSYYTDVDSVDSISAVEIASIDLINTDDGTSLSTTPDKIEVEKFSGGKIDENGEFINYTVTLNEAPTDDVVIALSSSDTTEANVSLSTLTFTTGNWSTPQLFKVYGIDDNESDGDISVTITIEAATSNDGNFNGFDVSDLSLTNYDNESSSSSSVISISNVVKTSSAYTADVVLTSAPTQDVTLTFAYTFNPGFTDNFLTANGLVVNTPASKVFTFTSANWNTPQTLEIGRVTSSVLFLPTNSVTGFGLTSASADTNFNAIEITIDDLYFEDSGKEPVFSVTDNVISANDDNGSFSVVLPTAPVAGDITLNFSFLENTENSAFTGDRSLAELNSSSLVFTSSNWNTPQIVNVGMKNDDGIVNGDRTYEVFFYSMTNSDGTVYNVSSLNTLEFIEEEINSAGIVITGSDLNTSESGSSATFLVQLASQPAGDMNISLESNNTLEGIVSSPSSKTLYFTINDWNVTQSVTVSGVDDSDYDKKEEYNITLTAYDDLDNGYNGKRAYVNVFNSNDDTVDFTLTINNLLLSDNNLSEVWLIGKNGNSEYIQLDPSYDIVSGNNVLISPVSNLHSDFALKFVTVKSGVSTYWWYNFSDGKLYEHNDGSSNFITSISLTNSIFTIDSFYENWIGTPTEFDVIIDFGNTLPSQNIEMNLTIIDVNSSNKLSVADIILNTTETVPLSIPANISSFYLQYETNASSEYIKTGYYSSLGESVYSLKDATPLNRESLGSSVTFPISQGYSISGTLYGYSSIEKLFVYPIRVDGEDPFDYDMEFTGVNQYSVRIPSGDYKLKFLVKDNNSIHRDLYSSTGLVKTIGLAEMITLSSDLVLDINKTSDTQSVEIPYVSGWNLVSIPAKMTLDSNDLRTLFSDTQSISHLVKYNTIFQWNYFWVDKTNYISAYSRFTEIDSTDGFWLKAYGSGAVEIPLTGEEVSYSDEIKNNIVSGWNLIGFPYLKSVSNVVTLVESSGNIVDSLWVFRAGVWYSYFPSYEGYSTLSSGQEIYSYEGIWIKVQ